MSKAYNPDEIELKWQKLREEKSRASTRRLAPDRRLSEGILAR